MTTPEWIYKTQKNSFRIKTLNFLVVGENSEHNISLKYSVNSPSIISTFTERPFHLIAYVCREHDEDFKKSRKFEITGSVSSISTVLSHNDLWDAVERRSTEHGQIRRTNSDKALSSIGDHTARKTGNLMSERTSFQHAVKRLEHEDGATSAEFEKLKTKYERYCPYLCLAVVDKYFKVNDPNGKDERES